MSTVAGLFFVNSPSGKDLPSAACSMTDPENNQTLSEDDNTSCSNSEMSSEVYANPGKASNLSLNHKTPSTYHDPSDNNNSGSSRRNKRKNFMPRNILEYAGSDEDEDHPNHKRNSGSGTNSGLALRSHSHQRDTATMNLSMNSPEDEETEDDEEHTDLRMDITDSPDTPLDLSEVQNDSKRLWRKPDFMNASSFIHRPESQNCHDRPSPHQQPFLPFSPMDLSRLAGSSGGSRAEDMYDEERSNDLVISSTSSNSNNSLHNGNSSRTTPSAAALTDFAESTMKELLGLYGIAQTMQAGGKPGPTDIPSLHRQLTSGSDSGTGQANNKMMLPENMVRLLAAMQESVHAANNNVSTNNCHNSTNSSSATNSPSRNHHNSSPNHNHSSPSTIQQAHVTSGSGGSGSSVLKSQLHSNNNNQGEVNNHSSSNNNHSHSHGSLHQQSKGLRNNKNSNSAKNSASGRGLTSFPVIREGLLGKGSGPVDYTRYVRRFGSSAECGYQHCRDLNYREHFHCLDCGQGARVFVKKEEMIRHFKWHKKRDESLQHGFMRYSPSDDCSDRFHNCTHNRKQTHYHCLHDPCEKVYISTSDVQMHANYHRKDSAIIQEGFQRFRAAEDCGTDHCTFRHQRTTHFHCRRSTCSYTFKNKADMEKHKSYHIKDEQLNRDGFKKFMKHETCQYPSCRFSRVCNHIHCIREGCNYVLHSSGQLYSHKRKHERRDSELAYRKFKLAQSVMRGTFGAELSSLSESLIGKLDDDNHSHSSMNDQIDIDSDDAVKKFVQPCNCDITPEDHYHCRAESCVHALLGNAEVASEHSRSHELEDRISSLAYFTVDPANFDAQDSTIPCVSAKCAYQHREKHYHCLWDGCSEVILATDEPFKRLEHFKEHETTQKLEFAGIEKPSSESLDGFFKRKRGRPPKNRTIEVSSGANEAIFTSFKLPKPIFSGLHVDNEADADMKDPIGFLSYNEGTPCPDTSCSFNTSQATAHYHCGHPRCHFSVEDVHKLSLHLRDFHSNVDILDGYEYYDRNSDCRETSCEFNGSASHFHCLRDGYIFSRYSSMTTHEADCHDSKSTNESSDEEEKPWNGQVVKSKGTFYPMPVGKEKRNNENNPMDLSSPNGDSFDTKPITDHSLSRILQLPTETSETQFGPEVACGRPFCKLKRKSHYHCHLCNQAFSDLDKLRPHVSKHSNLTLKKEPESNSDSEEEKNESDHERDMKLFTFTPTKVKKEDPHQHPHPQHAHQLRSHSIPQSPSLMSDGSTGSSPSTSFTPTSLSSFLGYPGSHSPYLFLQQNPLTSLYAGMMFGGGGATPYPSPGLLSPPPPSAPNQMMGTNEPSSSSLSPLQLPTSVLKRPPSNSSIPSPPPDAKKQRLQIRILKDEPVPDGYVRFRFNEDCAYVHCGYREHQTHFHCTREDCGYSFCDKTRFVQHTARHERLDTLMGGDFKQFRASVPCGRIHCSYTPSTGTCTSGQQNKASHFHCSKCDFVCTDTNKVVAHRRQHQKLDSIMAAGFEKFTPSQHCHIDSCIHAQKQTHYHCLKCSYAVLGLSQMSAHKYRHAD